MEQISEQIEDLFLLLNLMKTTINNSVFDKLPLKDDIEDAWGKAHQLRVEILKLRQSPTNSSLEEITRQRNRIKKALRKRIDVEQKMVEAWAEIEARLILLGLQEKDK